MTPILTPKKIKPLQSKDYKGFCGERGIRTTRFPPLFIGFLSFKFTN